MTGIPSITLSQLERLFVFFPKNTHGNRFFSPTPLMVQLPRLYIATVGEAHSLPLRHSRLGSLPEGAGSPNGLTEGVSHNERRVPMVLYRPP